MSFRKADDKTEARLRELRSEAMRKGSVDAAGIRPGGAPFPVASAESGYYGTALLKPHQWTWEIPFYFFVGGAAGAAAIVGGSARASGADEQLWRDARWIAAGGAVVSTLLLVSDLGRPERFLNMLRVFKKQSAMSVGVWTVVAFSTTSAAAALAAWLDRKDVGGTPLRVLGDLAALGSMVSGAGMATYTGVLIGATAVPVWNQSVGKLPAIFGASGLGSAVALLELRGHRQSALNLLGGAAAIAETVLAASDEMNDEPALVPAKKGKSGAMIRAGALLSGPIHLLFRLTGSRRAAAVSMIAGSLLTRYGWMEAGKVSARDPVIPLQLEPEEPNLRIASGREPARR
jgi:hypothetical protein